MLDMIKALIIRFFKIVIPCHPIQFKYFSVLKIFILYIENIMGSCVDTLADCLRKA